MKYVLLATVILALVAPAAARAADETAEIEKLRANLTEAETLLERYKRILPGEFDLSAERATIDKLAAKAELQPVAVKLLDSEIPTLPDGRPAPIEIHRLELAGEGGFGAVHFFLSMLRIRAALTGIESARFDAGGGGSVRFAVRLAYPTWTSLPPDTDKPRDVLTAYRQQFARIRGALDVLVATTNRLRERDPIDALKMFTQSADPHAIALTSARIDDALSIDGLVLGADARAALPEILEKATLRPTRLEWSRKGPCEAFSLTAAIPPARDNAEFTSGSEVFDGDAAAFCSGEAQPSLRKIRVGATGDSASFLRLRDVELVDVFFVLNDLLGEDFVVDAEVKGRADLDASETASIDDLFKAIQSPDLVIGSGALRRVSRAKAAARTARPAGAASEPINISFRDADVADVLCLFGQISGREMRLDRDQQRRVSVFATEVPVGEAIDQLLPSPSAKAVNPCELSVHTSSRLSGYRLKDEQMAIADLRIAGLARAGDTWRAYAIGPTRRVLVLEPGQRFFDGTVKSIESSGVTFASDAKGAIVVPLSR